MFVMRAGPAPAVDAGRMRARDLAHFLGVGGDRCSVAGSSRGTGGLGVAGPDLFLRVVAGWGRACACDASWSQNTGMGLALPH